MVRKNRTPSVVIGALVALAGCRSLPEVDVERQWADSMRRLNMFGFYPMTEDVQVGDVYLHVPPRDNSASLPRFSLVRIASYRNSAVRHELLGQQERHRMRIQPLPAAKSAEGGAAPAREPAGAISDTAACGGYDIGHADDAGCPVRLQRSAIPGLTVGRITTGQLGAAGVFGNFGARLGLGASSQTAVSITLRNVQELSLDAWRTSRLRNNHERDLLDLVRAEELLFLLGQLGHDLLGQKLLADACNGRADRLADQRVEVLVVNRVIYAGGVEYNFTRNAETAVRAALDLQSVLPGQPQAPVIPSLAPGAGSGSSNPAAAVAKVDDPTAAGQRLAALLQATTGESGTAGARAGVTTNFGVGTFGTLSLKQDYNRPMAVGAGSRVRYSFHDMLAGSSGLTAPDGRSLAEFRFDRAREYCARVLRSGFDESALRAAMGVP